MRDYVFINEDGTVKNILNLVGPEAIELNDDLKDLLWFDYTDWQDEDKPGPQWTYNKDTEVWSKFVPFNSAPIPTDIIEAIAASVEAEPIDGDI